MYGNDKVAIISDIHANLKYLKRALTIIDDYQIDQIICCGDIIGYGIEPNECCELIRSLNCVTVAGNHQEFPDGAAQPSESLKFVHRSVAGSENILLTAA